MNIIVQNMVVNNVLPMFKVFILLYTKELKKYQYKHKIIKLTKT